MIQTSCMFFNYVALEIYLLQAVTLDIHGRSKTQSGSNCGTTVQKWGHVLARLVHAHATILTFIVIRTVPSRCML